MENSIIAFENSLLYRYTPNNKVVKYKFNTIAYDYTSIKEYYVNAFNMHTLP